MKKKTKNTNQSINSKKGNVGKGTYNLDDYRNKKSTSYQAGYKSKLSQAQTKGMEKNKVSPNAKSSTQKRKQAQKSVKTKHYDTNSYTNNYTPSYETKYRGDYQSQSRYKDPSIAREEIRSKNKISRKEAQQLKQRKKSNYRKRVALVIVAVMCAVFASIKLIDMFRYPTVSYQTVRMGMVDNSQKVQGLIVREEKVYNSVSEGNIHYLTGEGQKVRKDGEVCYISQDEALDKISTEMEKVDNSIYNIQDKREGLSEYQTEIYTLNSGIVSEIKAFYNNRSSERTNEVYGLRKQLDRIVQTRTELYVNEPSERTEALQQDRLNLVKEIKDYHNVVKAKEAGTVSYMLDGQENALKISNLQELKYEVYQDILKNNELEHNNKSIGQTIKDTPIYKLIVDDKWQIVSYIEPEIASGLKEGDLYDLVFNDIVNSKVNFMLESKVEEGERVKLVFTTRDQLVKFLPYRKVEFTIGENKAEGLKIPLNAIVEKNVLRVPVQYIQTKEKEQGVMKQVGEMIEFIPVNVQYKIDEYAYILQDLTNLKSIQVNDTIVNADTKEKFKVSEVQAVQGVYTINGRFAKFKQIDVALSNKEYAIIKPNSQLKEFDQIISNPKSIKEDQLLKFMNIQNE
ncbi:MAG: HlyD family efflux transporter periplasmic adaptor subunit [Cellulosilyticaceae bacterium]